MSSIKDFMKNNDSALSKDFNISNSDTGDINNHYYKCTALKNDDLTISADESNIIYKRSNFNPESEKNNMDFFVQEMEDKKEIDQKIDHIKNNFMEKKTDFYKRNKMIKDNNKKFIEITKNAEDLNSKKNITKPKSSTDSSSNDTKQIDKQRKTSQSKKEDSNSDNSKNKSDKPKKITDLPKSEKQKIIENIKFIDRQK